MVKDDEDDERPTIPGKRDARVRVEEEEGEEEVGRGGGCCSTIVSRLGDGVEFRRSRSTASPVGAAVAVGGDTVPL